MVEKNVDLLVSSKLKEQGYTDKDINYGYTLPSTGDKNFTPDKKGQNIILSRARKQEQSLNSLFLLEKENEKLNN